MAHARELRWLQHSVGVLSLGDRAIISVSGDDAREWLQGQLTNQFEGVEPGDSLYAFVLTLKGRVLADVYALVREDDVWLDVPANAVDALLERFDRYIIMEDVDLDYRDDLRVITAQGPRAGEVAEEGWPADRLGVGVEARPCRSGTATLRGRLRRLDLPPGDWAEPSGRLLQ
jgi:folate-binding Fe-S cluster repair protein YgfZ